MIQRMIRNLHLEKLFWIIRSKLLMIILAVMVGAVLGAGVGVLTGSTIYRAEISLYVYSNPEALTDTDINISNGDIAQARGLVDSYMQILRSRSFLRDVLEESGMNYYMDFRMLDREIGAEAVSTTSVFKVYVYDRNPERAQLIANTIGELAPDRIISVVKSGGIEIMDRAELPTEPYAKTSIRMMVLIGAVGGLGLSVLWALFRGLNDTRIRRRYEITDLFTPEILADIPQMASSADAVLQKGCDRELTEAYRNLRASILCRQEGETGQLYAVTSADPGEGKTTTAVNLASAAAAVGKKTILLNADLRKSSEDEGKDKKKAENECMDLASFLREETGELKPEMLENGVCVLPLGKLDETDAELLFSERFRHLLEKCREEYDLILVDLPPLGVFSDALCLAAEADGYLIVVREKITRTERVELLVRKLESAGAAIRGFIYNGISRTSPDYNYGEKARNYGYHEKNLKKTKKGIKVQTNAG
uniref:polysaccharide biosynthesis tyrosine autokinase n=1 Tax=Eubacterium cellulosolvens TaxID=29322 RepID=UPI00047F3B9D|nr:polysaccharide biosynthesis tyrosine autokinase [[Eubacterium] cellulosolvens]